MRTNDADTVTCADADTGTDASSPPARHARQREPEGRSPARMRRQGRAKQLPRQGGLRVGVGGRCNQTKPANQHSPHPPNIRGSASPKGEARRKCAAKREARGREDYGWGWAGGVIKPIGRAV